METLPQRNGLEATRIITERSKERSQQQNAVTLKRPHIVFLTAHALTSFRAQASEVGAKGFLSKPYKLEEIKAVLQSVSVSVPGECCNGEQSPLHHATNE